MKINNKGYAITIIVFGILIVFVTVLSTLLITMNNSVKLNKTVKESVVENIQLSADTSGMSLTERIEILEKQMSNIKKEIYPVGSIYISAEDDTVEKVQERFGGTWEVYAQGRTLVGVGTTTDGNGNVLTYNSSQTGGSSLTQLSTSNLPSHSHTYTPSGNVTSTFTGTSVTTAATGNGYTLGHTCETRITTTDGTHSHEITNGGYAMTIYANSNYGGYTSGYGFASSQSSWWSNVNKYYGSITSNGAHAHAVADCYLGSLSGVAAHTHTVTAQGTVSSIFTGTESNVSSIGSGQSFSVQDPYITVYMYKRTE